jgi:signal transduction histidine kinase
VLHGLDSRCAACGAARFLLAAPNVSLAGQPSRVGGLAVSLIGATVLVLGLALSTGLWFLLQSIWPDRAFGWAFAIPTVSFFAGLLLLLGGRRLRKSGTAHQQTVQLDAVKAMVQHRKGPISAADVASALQLPEAQVDELLTRLAREQATAVTLDVDARGHVVYDFEGEDRRWRVLEEDAAVSAEAEAGMEAERARKVAKP